MLKIAQTNPALSRMESNFKDTRAPKPVLLVPALFSVMMFTELIVTLNAGLPGPFRGNSQLPSSVI